MENLGQVERSADEAPVEHSVTIGTWNMDHWRRTAQQRGDAWAFLGSDSQADVMLLQESAIPGTVPRTRYVHREIAGSRPWGSAVIALKDHSDVHEIDAVRTRYGATRFGMLGSHPGAVMVARVELPEVGVLTCISVYGVINVYSQTTMFRIVADLIPLFDSSHGDRVVLGGDFNVTTATGPDTPELPRYRAVLNAVESLGLVNLATLDISRPDSIAGCLCGAPSCRHIRTFGMSPGTQLDWLYATPELARRCTQLRVDLGVLGTLSDHAPIFATFRIGAKQRGRVVDPESFLAELGSRVGAESARIAEDLIDWALRKHGAIDRGGGRPASLDRLPTSSGDTPELWVQLDLRRPQGLQYTFSLTADGEVVVQFQHMTAPFDKPEAREQLWSKLNQIDGLVLEKRLNGRPRFSLSILTKPDRRELFERVFSEMIDDTLVTRSGRPGR